MSGESKFIFDMICAKFPDGVDVVVANCNPVRELVCGNALGNRFVYAEQGPSKVYETRLVEIEPETGIYAGMSEFSHNVFVYFAPEYYS